MSRPRLFILSPATAHGPRARGLLTGESKTTIARALASPEGAQLGEVFRYLSGLYFRGKLEYARFHVQPPRTMASSGVYIITMTDGLLAAEARVRVGDLQRFAAARDQTEVGQHALAASVRALGEEAGSDTDVVFLGSVGTGRYTDVLVPILGERLLFPGHLVGRGQLERGAILLRCVQEGRALECAPLAGLKPTRRPGSAGRREPGDRGAALPGTP